MSYNKYTIDQINIGDQVYFDDMYSGEQLIQSNFDEYWTVHGKDGNLLLVNLNNEHHTSVDIKDIRAHIFFSNSK